MLGLVTAVKSHGVVSKVIDGLTSGESDGHIEVVGISDVTLDPPRTMRNGNCDSHQKTEEDKGRHFEQKKRSGSSESFRSLFAKKKEL